MTLWQWLNFSEETPVVINFFTPTLLHGDFSPILVGPPGLLLADPRPYFGPRAAGCWTSGLTGHVLDPIVPLNIMCGNVLNLFSPISRRLQNSASAARYRHTTPPFVPGLYFELLFQICPVTPKLAFDQRHGAARFAVSVFRECCKQPILVADICSTVRISKDLFKVLI